MSSSSRNKPEVPLKPTRTLPPPVPLRAANRQPSQQHHQDTTTTTTGGLPPTGGPPASLDTCDYPMNATWLFHAPPSSGNEIGGIKRTEWIKERSKAAAAVDLPPKLCLKSVPVLPVKPNQNNSAHLVKSPKSADLKDSTPATTTTIIPRRDLNFTNEIKSRCSQRLTERLPPQVHYSKVSIIGKT